MKKIIIAGIAVLVLTVGLLVYKFQKPSLTKTYQAVKEDYTSYTMDGSLSMMDGENLREYQVHVDYAYQDETEYFLVSLSDPDLSQSQKIIRNAEGVFVVTPTLNRAFQFKSDWPYNSPKPYIYQSLLEVLEGEYESQKTDQGYQVTAPLSYAADPRVVSVEIGFDKNLSPLYVNYYDENSSEVIWLEINHFERNVDINQETFNIEKAVQEQTETSSASTNSSSLPYYPLELMGCQLSYDEQTEINGEMKHILKFEGDHHFTIVESCLSEEDELEILAMDGEVQEMAGGIAFISDDGIGILDNGVLCQIYSDTLSNEQMLQVATSLDGSLMK